MMLKVVEIERLLRKGRDVNDTLYEEVRFQDPYLRPMGFTQQVWPQVLRERTLLDVG